MSFVHHTRRRTTVSIAASGTDATAINLQGVSAASIQFPSAMTGTSVSFKSGAAGSELAVYQDGSLLTVPVTASKIERIPTDALVGESLVIVSSGAEASARSLVVHLMGGV